MTAILSFVQVNRTAILVFIALPLIASAAHAQLLQVKADRSAILKAEPAGEAPQVGERLSAGTRVEVIGDARRYYHVRVVGEQREGWSYKANFTIVEETPAIVAVTPEALLSRRDTLKIVVLDVEVGDSTLVICPEDDGERDVILIDTGEDDSDRIITELSANGFDIHAKPVTTFMITHYDFDHFGAFEEVLPLTRTLYDHGDNIKDKYKKWYFGAVNAPDVDRRTMTLGFEEQFSGGVTVECVAVNQATDFNPAASPSSPSNDNPNSIATIISYRGFDYFTAGDLTFTGEKALAEGIRNCDVYHADHHGSRATSSDLDFVKRLDPEVSVASNGTQHGHPSKDVADRLTKAPIKSKFYQTNINPDTRANRPAAKYVADDTYHEDTEEEEADGAVGNIAIVVDAASDRYFVVMPGLPLDEATFTIEH